MLRLKRIISTVLVCMLLVHVFIISKDNPREDMEINGVATINENFFKSPGPEEKSKMLGDYMALTMEEFKQSQQVQQGRKQRARHVCAKYSNYSVDIVSLQKSEEIIVDDKRKILFCYVPKVGCTSWKVRLVLGTGLTKDVKELTKHPSVIDYKSGLAKYGLKTLKSYSPEKVKHILQSYYKFMFTRHPLERLLSTYRSKWEKRKDNTNEFPFFYYNFLPELIDTIKKEDKRSMVTFEEFVKYLTIRSKEFKKMEPHWERYHRLCHMCEIDYDFYGKFDNFYNDIAYLLRMIYPLPEDYYFLNVTKPRSAVQLMKSYYGQLDSKLIYELEESYKLDYELFGYDINTIHGI